ncbi:MAG: ATP-dependent 6-phosphofructokinase [Verrucomicrobiota bacterium]|nr:ATP-dependent 6-phosphofructokinase [Verrucomicrobiota bacterium]
MKDTFGIRSLGPCRVESPLDCRFFVDDDGRVLLDATLAACRDCDGKPVALEQAGPRRRIFFEPRSVRAAVVTCGGLCPGLNDVIRALTMVLWHRYGARSIMGLRYGYEGLIARLGHEPIPLNPDVVADIHKHGGTILGSSRGHQDMGEMVAFLAQNRINVLFAIGGDGTQHGALEIARERERRNLDIAVVGIPKTIDNDISYTQRTFGFETAVAISQIPIASAHMESKGARNGVGLVKLMGRDCGFVAAYATLASSDVNLVLIPEVPFRLEKVMAFLESRLQRKSHAVIVVAEGAGQDLVPVEGADASGNKKLGDIGVFLKKAITEHFSKIRMPATVRYIDPSYMIRSAPANADDSVFCFQLAEKAVHAAMAGRTGLVVGIWNDHFVHVPMEKAIESRKKIDPTGALWQSVLDNTGQPANLM